MDKQGGEEHTAFARCAAYIPTGTTGEPKHNSTILKLAKGPKYYTNEEKGESGKEISSGK